MTFPKTPNECTHERFIALSGKCSGMTQLRVPHLKIDREGDYIPSTISGIGGGDYLNVNLCLDCGTAIGFKPMTDAEVREAVLGEDDEDSDA